MGVDIYGWVEVKRRDWDQWDGVIRIRFLVWRSYGMFGSLFGWRNEDHEFRPIAARRGSPEHVSEEYFVERDSYGGQVGETWALWRELAAIDWDEEGEAYIDDIGAIVGYEPGPDRHRERRRDYLTGGWALLFEMMALLARDHGPDNVRLTVWFDSV
jgi:hypothetical protein